MAHLIAKASTTERGREQIGEGDGEPVERDGAMLDHLTDERLVSGFVRGIG